MFLLHNTGNFTEYITYFSDHTKLLYYLVVLRYLVIHEFVIFE